MSGIGRAVTIYMLINAMALSMATAVQETYSDVSWQNEVVTETVEITIEDLVTETVVTEEPTVVEETHSYLTEKVPMDENTQFCTKVWCEQYGVPYTLALAVIQTESTFNPDAVNYDGTCFSYMQIHVVNEPYLKSALGIESIKNPLDNIRSGVYLLGGYIRKYEDLSMALMAYNHGEGGAQSKFAQGIYETGYTRVVLDRKAEWDAVLGKVEF